MKKLNHILIFSDGILGHEIQSIALASKIAKETSLYNCGLRQPWLSFAPRILPGFGKNIIWKNKKPDIPNAPDAIVTCGRRMAAIGKFYKRHANCKHIQILNPTDNPTKYDIIVCPEHDRMNAPNVIHSKGSLHNINPKMLLQHTQSCKNNVHSSHKKIITLMIGNPNNQFFNQLDQLYNQILQHYPSYQLLICGSRRTPEKYHKKIRANFKKAQHCWLNDTDGENPYLCLLASSDVLLVTADSINMVSEACATDKTVVALAQNDVSPKHKRFIQSVRKRLSDIGDVHGNPIPLDTLTYVAKQVVLALK